MRKINSIVLSVVCAVSLSGCVSRSPSMLAENMSFEEVNVFFATDRHMDINDTYVPVRFKMSDQRSVLRYGHCVVTIPQVHKVGNIEFPIGWDLFSPKTIKGDFDRYVYFNVAYPECLYSSGWFSDNECDKDQYHKEAFCVGDFWGRLNESVKASKSKKVLVYVHGYNNTFNFAAATLAQISKDIRFEGVNVLYAWPSKSFAYQTAESNSEWTVIDFKTFIVNMLDNVNSDEIYIVAHSMGGRVVANSLLQLIMEKRGKLHKIEHVILAAPDIDVDLFNRDMAIKLKDTFRVTIYTSRGDSALAVSEGKHTYPRVGNTGELPFVAEGIDTIDTTENSKSWIGHADHRESPAALRDIGQIINHNAPPEKRPEIVRSSSGSCAYWRLLP